MVDERLDQREFMSSGSSDQEVCLRGL